MSRGCMGSDLSVVCFPDADYTEIKNEFVASRADLPVMFISTPRDQRSSVWTKERPSAQVS